MKRIEVKGLSKTFVKKKRDGLLGILLHKRVLSRVVLEDIDLVVNSGEIVGITGPNGCGKSTLLRLIAGIYSKDSGSIIVRGKVVPLLNLKMGLEWRLSLVENIMYVGTLFGLSQKSIVLRMKKIISFAGLEGHEETPIYQFSEGMKQRLVFSVAMHADADVLLLDEVFEVGDANFRRKSSEAIKDFVKKGGAVVLVSHDRDVLKVCDRVVKL